jgi:hypothetical protein
MGARKTGDLPVRLAADQRQIIGYRRWKNSFRKLLGPALLLERGRVKRARFPVENVESAPQSTTEPINRRR